MPLDQVCLVMRVHQELPDTPPDKSAILTIGVFDGVHRGHQRLLRRVVEVASKEGMLSGVLTFVNHPRSVLVPDTCISYITSVEDRLALLKDAGVDMVIPLHFDLELSRLRAHEFTALLQERLRMAGLVMGYNFAMGYKREGTPETLAALGNEQGFSVTVVDAVSVEGGRVSSTVIRDSVTAGDVAGAYTLLGRAFTICGEVVAGKGRGRALLGFPTANLDLPGDRLVPGNGIYATWASVEGERYMAATNVGVNPTFGEDKRTVEAFLLDFDGDLYGKDLTLEFVGRLRDELRFESADALVAQMRVDVEQARETLRASTAK